MTAPSHPLERARRLELLRRFPESAPLPIGDAELAAMPLPEQRALLDTLPWRLKAELIRKSDLAPALVRGMHAADLVYTMEAAGDTEAAEMLLAAGPEQAAQVLDLTVWGKAGFDGASLLALYGRLLELDPERAVKRIAKLPAAYTAAALDGVIRVARREWFEAYEDATPDDYVALDETYTIEVKAEGPAFESAAALLQVMSRLDPAAYHRTLETLARNQGDTTELLDDLERDRIGRLDELGFPDPVFSAELFAYAAPEALLGELDRTVRRPPAPDVVIGGAVPVLLARAVAEQSLTARAVALLDPAAAAAVLDEWVILANRIAVTEGGMGRIDGARAAAARAAATVALGLERAVRARGLDSAGDAAAGAAAAVLERAPLVTVFRLGHNTVAEERRRLRGLIRRFGFADDPAALPLLPTVLRDPLRALLADLPLYDTRLERPAGAGPVRRPPERMDEVQRIAAAVDTAEALWTWLVTGLGLRGVPVGLDTAGVSPANPAEIDGAVLLFTRTAFETLGRPDTICPLEAADLAALRDAVTIDGFVRADYIAALKDHWRAQAAGVRPAQQPFVAGTIDEWAARYADNLTAGLCGPALHPQAMPHLLVRTGRGR